MFEKPVVLQSAKPLQFDQDCACPVQYEDRPASSAISINTTMVLKINPNLYVESVSNGYQLFFDQLNPVGVVVLNAASILVLERFRAPSSVDFIFQGEHELDRREFTDIVNKFFVAGLLIPVNPKYPSSALLKEKEEFPNQTLEVWLHLTNECNLRCDYCFVNKNSEFMTVDVAKAAVDALFRSAKQNNFRNVKIKYAGGEPLLNIKCLKFIHYYAKELSLNENISLQEVVLTNAVLIKESTLDFFVANHIRVMISLDGLGEKNDQQRHYKNQAGSFAQIEKAINLCLLKHYKPIISVTVTGQNCDGLKELMHWLLLKELPFTLNLYRESDASAMVTKMSYSEGDIISSLNEAFNEIKKSPPAYNLLGMLSDRARLDMSHDRVCGVGDSYLVISHKGEISKCQMHMDMPIASIRDHDPLQLIREDKLGVKNLKVFEKKQCDSCEWSNICAGGCPALTYRMTGRYDIKSPNCNIYKSIFPKILGLEAERLIYYM